MPFGLIAFLAIGSMVALVCVFARISLGRESRREKEHRISEEIIGRFDPRGGQDDLDALIGFIDSYAGGGSGPEKEDMQHGGRDNRGGAE